MISELLAILIHHGTKDKTAVDWRRKYLLLCKNSLAELGRLSVKELIKIKGIGKAKAIGIAAALEIGRRREASLPLEKTIIKGESREIANYLQVLLKDFNHEVFAVVFRTGPIK